MKDTVATGIPNRGPRRSQREVSFGIVLDLICLMRNEIEAGLRNLYDNSASK
jgi:hypothetical protein